MRSEYVKTVITSKKFTKIVKLTNEDVEQFKPIRGMRYST